MDGAQSYAEVLLIEDYWDIFENTLTQLPNPKFLNGYTPELYICRLYLLQIRWLLELLRSTLAQEIREHEFNLHKELHFRCLSIFQIKLHSEVSDVVQLYLFLTVADHEGTRVEGDHGFVYLRRNDVVMLEVSSFSLSLMLLLFLNTPTEQSRWLLLLLLGYRLSHPICSRYLWVEDCVGLCIVQLKQ